MPSAKQTKKTRPKSGVFFYSYQTEYLLFKDNFNGLFVAAHHINAF